MATFQVDVAESSCVTTKGTDSEMCRPAYDKKFTRHVPLLEKTARKAGGITEPTAGMSDLAAIRGGRMANARFQNEANPICTACYHFDKNLLDILSNGNKNDEQDL